MEKCIDCDYLATVGGNYSDCKLKNIRVAFVQNGGCKSFKPKYKRLVALAEDDVKQLTEFSNFIIKLTHNLSE